jgi:hypothetical protein
VVRLAALGRSVYIRWGTSGSGEARVFKLSPTGLVVGTNYEKGGRFLDQMTGRGIYYVKGTTLLYSPHKHVTSSLHLGDRGRMSWNAGTNGMTESQPGLRSRAETVQKKEAGT